MKALLIAAGGLLPAPWQEWVKAMTAELEEIPPGAERRRFAGGCARAILAKAVELRIRLWLGQPALLLAAFGLGLVIALVDQASDSRTFMWVTLLTGSAVAGWCRPGGAWRWGVLLAIGIPFVSLADSGGGPYAIDRADSQYGLLPAIAAASVAAFCRRHVWATALWLIVIGLVPRSLSAQVPAPRRELTAADLAGFADSAFAEYLRLSPEPSLAFVVVNDDSILFARGYGSEDPAGIRSVDPHATVFWMGSVSKLITAAAVMREIALERLSLDTFVRDRLDWPLPSRAGWREVTVRDLLTHTSGIDEPFMMGNADRPEELTPLAQYLSRVRWRAGRPPGDILRYSNHGMALAGLLVEQSSGTSFAEYVEREIFAPRGMKHSSFGQPLSPELARRLATAGTDARADFLLPAPAGAMVGTAADMGRFLISQLDTAGVMHATRWRGHPSVPGVALGWFETVLGGVPGLYHTGARHHFSVAWIVPSQRVGVVLVHSMRQGGRFQSLRSTLIREFAVRYLSPDSVPVKATSSRAVAGVYRPLLLGTTTVERLGYLVLDTPLEIAPDGAVTLRAPGELGTVRAEPIGDDVFEIRDGPQAGLRIGFVAGTGPARIALGGTLLDPVVLVRMSWWERGMVHALALGGASLVLTLAGAGYTIRSLIRRRREEPAERDRVKLGVMVAAAGFILALVAFLGVIVATPEAGAAAHMRAGLHAVLVFLMVAWVGCLVIPALLVLQWRQRAGHRIAWSMLAICGAVAAGLLWHYRLVGFRL